MRLARWEDDEAVMRIIREQVFIREQKVPEDLEWDGLDAECVHALAFDNNGIAMGTGRLHPSGKIGRMAVLESWRGKGVGASILQLLMDEARRQGLPGCELNAQTYALGFYQRFGFVAEGPEFDDAGIPHRHMSMQFTGQSHD
ncbi:MAG: GNAT family N-acetyltransferase [Gammaproteobacteria bacterium]